MIDYLILLGLVSSSLTGGIKLSDSNVSKKVDLQNVPSITPSKLNSKLSLSQKEIANVELIMLLLYMGFLIMVNYCVIGDGMVGLK